MILDGASKKNIKLINSIKSAESNLFPNKNIIKKC